MTPRKRSKKGGTRFTWKPDSYEDAALTVTQLSQGQHMVDAVRLVEIHTGPFPVPAPTADPDGVYRMRAVVHSLVIERQVGPDQWRVVHDGR